MDLGRLLRQKFNAYVAAHDKWFQNEFNLDLSNEERQEYRASVEEARTDMHQVMDDIRQHEDLVLASVSEARAFSSLLPDFLANRGNLNRVRVQAQNMGNASRTEISRLLENAGLRREETEIVFRFPAQ